MGVIYKCRECQKVNNMGEICEFCFGPIEKVFTKDEAPKKENPFTKEKAIQFLKSQQFVSQKFAKDKRVYEKYRDLIEFINKAIPDENQNSLF